MAIPIVASIFAVAHFCIPGGTALYRSRQARTRAATCGIEKGLVRESLAHP